MQIPSLSHTRHGRPSRLTVVIVLATGAWAFVAIGYVMDVVHPPGPAASPLMLLVVPLGLATLVALDHRLAGTALSAAAGWTALLSGALLSGLYFVSSPTVALAVPVIALAAVLCARRPAAAVVLVVAISGAYGSLIAFWHVPVEKSIALGVVGLLIAALARLFWRRRADVRVAPASLLLVLYVVVTVAGILSVDQRSIAIQSFQSCGLYALAALVIAYGGWPLATHERIAKGILVAGALVGAYATLRWQIGPADQEAAVSPSIYNTVDGKLKVFGSLPTGQDLGVWTAAAIPFCAALGLSLADRRWKALAVAAVGLCTVALLVSDLRAALVGLVVGLAVVVVLYAAAQGLPGVRIGQTAVALFAGGALIAGGLAVTGTGHSPSHSFSSLLNAPRSDPSVDARLYKWDQALVDLSDHPFGYGVGTASFSQAEGGRFKLNVGARNVDNAYLKVALEQGLAVMGLFIAALLVLLIALARGALTAANPVSAAIMIGATGTLASFAVVGTTANIFDGPRALVLWAIVGLALAQLTRRAGARERAT